MLVWASCDNEYVRLAGSPFGSQLSMLHLSQYWEIIGDRPLSEPTLACSLTHICISRPQCVNKSTLFSQIGSGCAKTDLGLSHGVSSVQRWRGRLRPVAQGGGTNSRGLGMLFIDWHYSHATWASRRLKSSVRFSPVLLLFVCLFLRMCAGRAHNKTSIQKHSQGNIWPRWNNDWRLWDQIHPGRDIFCLENIVCLFLFSQGHPFIRMKGEELVQIAYQMLRKIF